MAKKLISVWLSLTILIFSSISIYADEVIQGDFFLKNIVINGENIVNYQLSNPVLVYADRVYIPMDTEMGYIMGFKAELDNESRTLKILKTDPAQSNVSDKSAKNNLDAVSVKADYDMTVEVQTDAQNEDARLITQADATESDQSSVISAIYRIFANAKALAGEEDAAEDKASVTDTQIDLKGLPVLVRNEIVYVPLNAIVSSETLGWTLYYDAYAGIYISTDDEKDAASYFNAGTSRYYQGLTAYIVKTNPKLTTSQAYEMVKYFEAYGQIYGVDLKLLMAMAQSESTFTPSVESSAGCCGLMQIKVSTGNNYGFTRAQLFQVKPNIQMGAILVGDLLAKYGGNQVTALSAYNYGTGAVAKGSYSTGYANRIISRAAGIQSFVSAY